MMKPPIMAIDTADIKGPEMVFPCRGILTGGMQSASPIPNLYPNLHSAPYVIKSDFAGA